MRGTKRNEVSELHYVDVPGCDYTPKKGAGNKLRQDKKEEKVGGFGSWGG